MKPVSADGCDRTRRALLVAGAALALPAPVLVYIRGGGYDTGSGSAALYDGARLCRGGDPDGDGQHARRDARVRRRPGELRAHV